jgi:murein DD-endopeptidase MepM/ murein hydrolase activator NlpD
MGGSARRRITLVLVVGALTASGGWAAEAGPSIFPPPRPTTSTSSPSTTLPDPTTSTSQPALTLRGRGSTTTTGPATTTTTSPKASTTSSTTTTIGPGNIPADMQAQIDAVKRTPPNNTNALLSALQPLVDFGLSQDQAAVLGMGRFPVGGRASWSDDWLYPRFDGTFHLHQGNDVFAALGTPVRSPADGNLRQATDPLGGTVLFITEADGTYYYLAHLSAYAPGEPATEKVTTGQLVGFVGNTGDAAGGPTHLHFEIHPRGGAAVDPKPFLDSWVSQAIAGAPALTQRLFPGSAGGKAGAGGGRLILADASAGVGFAAPLAPSRSELAWASAASPAGGPLQLAAAQAEVAARGIDWTAEAEQASTVALAWAQAQQRARTLLAPLTPPELAWLLGSG